MATNRPLHQRRKPKHHRHGSAHNGTRSSDQQQADDFLVFGYSAKLNSPRNEQHGPSMDEQQQPLDESVHLIPWNGDDRLKIDRIWESALKFQLLHQLQIVQHVFSGFFSSDRTMCAFI
uniref:E3 ubiquitin-protein ligase n=1 Tax=Globodera pallida TaxID=36090 RepID=A0A183CQT1_GLOPA